MIGNNDYQNITQLKTAVKDARAVAKMLRERYNFEVTLLINATRSDLFTAFSKLRRKLQTSDNLLIYYAGHGVMDKQTQRRYWLPVDAQRSIKSNWVANEDITSELKAIAAKHVLIVADSCYSGTLTRSLDMDSLYEIIRRRVVLNADQTPLYSDIRFVGHDDGDFIFFKIKA